ncbi:hypothetical protein [Sphingobacterium sp. xlx-130]|uniref:hypothetical protein n=1 Tax=Sphingobacterium sp. xlx-130 TaxID=2654323 RepID=UPI0013DBC00E|nr:hypothetical protein [Sphingobacterium sp. xlx-130]
MNRIMNRIQQEINMQQLLSRYLNQLASLIQSRIVGVSFAKLKEEKLLSDIG